MFKNYSDRARDLHNRRQSGVPNEEKISSETDHDNLMKKLKEQEAQKRESLLVISKKRELTILKALLYHEKVTQKLSQIKRKERFLSSQAGQILKSLKVEEKKMKTLSHFVQRVQKQRKDALGKIANPSWSVSHHYHMTAIEHTSGHSQQHVMDVISMIRGHSRIYALANAASRFQGNASRYLSKARSTRMRSSDQIRQVYQELLGVRDQIKFIEKLIDTFKARFGGPKKIEMLKRSHKADLAKMRGQNLIKRKSLEEFPISFNTQRNSLNLTAELKINSDHQFQSNKKAVEVIETDIKRPPPVADGPSRGLGYRNIKMKFFQALNLGPPELKQNSSNDSVLSELTGIDFENESQSSSITEPAISPKDVSRKVELDEEYEQLKNELHDIVMEFDPLDREKTLAWAELETLLDHRERISYEIRASEKAKEVENNMNDIQKYSQTESPQSSPTVLNTKPQGVGNTPTSYSEVESD